MPRILAGSKPGSASTWIGAEGVGPPDRAPFVQVGINEERWPAEGFLPAMNHYYAYWSDTTHHFHPVFLAYVYPGDRVVANLSRHRSKWRISITDEVLHATYRVSTNDETETGSTYADWLQEDPSAPKPGQPLPYPRLSAVHFDRVRVNSFVPLPGEMVASAMSVPNNADLWPGLFVDGSFTLPSVH